MSRLDRLCEEADEAWRCTDGDRDARGRCPDADGMYGRGRR